VSRRLSDLEVRLQGYKERVRDVDADVVQQIRDRLAPAWPFYVERYAVGLMQLYVHLRIRPADPDAYSRDYVVVVKASRPWGGIISHDHVLKDRKDDLGVLDDGVGGVQKPMFVVVVDVGEDGEGVPIGVIPSLIRLCLPNDPLGVGMHATDALSSIAPEVDLPGVDRELDLLEFFGRGWSGVSSPECVRDVIQRRAQVVSTVADSETPLPGRVVVDLHAHDDLAFVLRMKVKLANWCVRVSVSETEELSVQGLKVSPCVA